MLIGIVGKSGSGKSTLAKKLCELDSGFFYIEIDKIGHEILSQKEVIQNIISIIGDSSILENGKLNRKKIGNIIFKDKDKYEKYYRYTENVEYKIIDEIILKHDRQIILLDWALLYKSKYWEMLDYKLLVETNDEIRKKRVILRDNISEEYFYIRDKINDNYNKEGMDYIINGDNIKEDVLRTIIEEIRNGK